MQAEKTIALLNDPKLPISLKDATVTNLPVTGSCLIFGWTREDSANIFIDNKLTTDLINILASVGESIK